MVGVMSPEVSMVTPRFSAKGRSVSVASSAMRDRSTCSRVKDRWSARLSRSKCFGEVDRSGVDGVEAVDELAVVAVRIVAGHVEKRLRDRQRGAQFVGGVGCESLLFGDCVLRAARAWRRRRRRVRGTRLCGPVAGSGGRAIRSRRAGGVGDAGQGGEHPAGEKPPSQETEHQQEPSKMAAAGAKSRRSDGPGDMRTMPTVDDDGLASVGHVSQEEHPHGASSKGPASMTKPA
jgi:hypothetical protein